MTWVLATPIKPFPPFAVGQQLYTRRISEDVVEVWDGDELAMRLDIGEVRKFLRLYLTRDNKPHLAGPGVEARYEGRILSC